MTKLHGIIALRDGIQSRAHKAITELHKLTQKRELYEGLSRTYRPKVEGGEALPAESTEVQLRANLVLASMTEVLTPYWNLMATQDRTNQEARADVVITIDGKERTILSAVPATHLLFLEKQLDDVRTFITKLPTLSPAKVWDWDEALGLQRTPAVETVRNKKTPRNHVLAEATERHPAQVTMYYEDVLDGYWSLVNFSGALKATQVAELLARINVVSDAVKAARQRANDTDVTELTVAKPIFDFILGA